MRSMLKIAARVMHRSAKVLSASFGRGPVLVGKQKHHKITCVAVQVYWLHKVRLEYSLLDLNYCVGIEGKHYWENGNGIEIPKELEPEAKKELKIKKVSESEKEGNERQ